MPTDPSDKPKQDWMHQDGAENLPGGADPLWAKGTTPDTVEGSDRSRRIQIITAGLAVTALIVAIILVLNWPTPPSPLTILGLYYRYEENLAIPHHVAGRKGMGDFEKWKDQHNQKYFNDKRLGITFEKAEFTSDQEAWKKALTHCKNAKSLILIFAVHGGHNSSEGLFLIPQDARFKDDKADKAAYAVPLRAVLQALENLQPETKKLLVLDISQPTDHLPSGQLHNNFAEILQRPETLKQIEKTKNLLVLCASDAHQRSWPSAELGTTAFLHFVLEGLKGAADIQTAENPEADGHGNVSVWELFSFVKGKVKHWVRHNRDALQEPILLPESRHKEARDLVLLTVQSDSYSEPDYSKAEFTGAAKLGKAWESLLKLNDARPSPAVVAPHRWRLALDKLLRAEQLWRAGDEDNAGELLKEVGKLQGDIRNAQHMRSRLDSEAGTLAMPRALSRLVPEVEQQQALFAKAAGSLEDLREAGPALEAFQGLGRLRSAEAHYAVMLHRHYLAMPPLLSGRPPDWPLLRASLNVRRLAEEAALGLKPEADNLPPYSEQVQPWIQLLFDGADGADQQRRDAQDLLFAERKEDGKAQELLKSAKESYERGQNVALGLRTAFFARDRALAELPYYTRWVGSQPQSVHEATVTKLWKDVHSLRRRLLPQGAKLTAEGAAELAAKLGRDGTEVMQELDALRDAHLKDCSRSQWGNTQSDWHEIEQLLAVPFIPSDRRVILLDASHRISRKLHGETRENKNPRTMDPKENKKQDHEQTRRRGLLILEQLGREWPGPDKAGFDYDTVEGEIKQGEFERGDFERAGEKLARHWRKNGEQARLSTEGGLKAPLLEEADRKLARAADLTRQLDGGAVEAWLADLDPPQKYREVRWHDLLCWQAERTSQDYWAEVDGKEPYYRRAGLVFVEDAKKLQPDQADQKDHWMAARTKELAKRLTEMAVPAAGHLVGSEFQEQPPILHVTDEQSISRSYGLRAPKGMPPGYPVVWAESAALFYYRNPGDGDRRVVDKAAVTAEAKPEGSRQTYELVPVPDLVSSAARKDEKGHVFRGVFRGHRFDVKTEVHRHYRPDVTAYQPPVPQTASVAVQADPALLNHFQADSMAITIVLDCSRSMETTIVAKDKVSRFKVAVAALTEVLKRLREGVQVSLWIFIADPADENARPRHVQLRKLSPWRQSERDALIDRIRNLKPWGSTPLVRATWMAKDDLVGFKGIKTMVILTDGADTHFYPFKDEKTNWPGDAKLLAIADNIPSFLEKVFGGSGIHLNVIGFDLDKKDQGEKAHLQFKSTIEEKKLGKYYPASYSNELVDALERFLLPLRFRIDPGTGKVPTGVVRKEGADILGTDLHPQWIEGLTEGSYKLNVRTTSAQEQDQPIRLGSGDRLLVGIRPAKNRDGFDFERRLYSKADFFGGSEVRLDSDRKKDLPTEGWHLAVVEDSGRQKGGYLRVLLEKQPEPDTPSVIQQVKPEWFWAQVSAQGGPAAAPQQLRFWPTHAYPAPAWKLHLPDWPSGQAPVMNVWWSHKPPRVAATASPGGKPSSVPVQIDDWRIPREKDAHVYMESIGHEEHMVGTNQDDQRTQKCLVVRLRWDVKKDRPFLVRPGDGFAAGHEHRIYENAGKYTGIFWNPAGGAEPPIPQSFELMSLKDVMERALVIPDVKLRALR